MTFKNIFSHNDINEYISLCKSYIFELQQFDSSIQTKLENEILETLNSEFSEKFLITDNDEVIGFIIIGYGLENSFSGKDKFIEEFYIKKTLQRKGFGKKAIDELCKKYPNSDFSAFIINNNSPAISFWESAFDTDKYSERCFAGNINATSDNLIFKYWAKI